MLRKAREFAARLHEDESGPNTVEWVLLIIVALVVLVGIYMFVQWAFDKLGGGVKDVEGEEPELGI